MPLAQDLLNVTFYRQVLFNGLRIVFIIVFALICTGVSRRLIAGLRGYVVRAMLKAGGGTEYEVGKRTETVGAVLRKSIDAVVWVVALIMILQEMNFDVRPLLAGAGVVGLAVGIGAQNLVRDVFAGFFLLLDNQIRLNDVVVINGTGGLVEEINLRTTILRSEDGALHVFPNGSIQKLSNLTKDFAFAVFSIAVNYRDDPDRVIAELRGIAAQMAEEEPYKSVIWSPLEVMGVDQLGESSVIVKARFKTKPMEQWTVAREMNRRIKKRFGEAGFLNTFPTRTIQLASLSPEVREEVKDLVRDVLQERNNPA